MNAPQTIVVKWLRGASLLYRRRKMDIIQSRQSWRLFQPEKASKSAEMKDAFCDYAEF